MTEKKKEEKNWGNDSGSLAGCRDLPHFFETICIIDCRFCPNLIIICQELVRILSELFIKILRVATLDLYPFEHLTQQQITNSSWAVSKSEESEIFEGTCMKTKK